MSQRVRIIPILVLLGAFSITSSVYADDLSGDEMDEIFDDVNHGSESSGDGDGGGTSTDTYSSNESGGDLEDSPKVAATPAKESFSDSLPAGFERRENVDDDNDAESEINNVVGDSLTESNSFQSYTPEPEVTADRFIHGYQETPKDDPGSFNYEPKKKKKSVAKKKSSKKKMASKKSKSKKVAKASKSSKSKGKGRKVASSKKSKNKRIR